MKQVTAFEDGAGRLHKTKKEAVREEFIHMLQRVWGMLPDCRDRGDPVVIARCLADSPGAQNILHEALLFLEEHKAA